MAKEKTKIGVPNRHLHARISYLQQAATYLATAHISSDQPGAAKDVTQGGDSAGTETTTIRGAVGAPLSTSPVAGPYRETRTTPKNYEKETQDSLVIQQPSSGGLPLLLSSHMAQVARKSQIRLDPSVKHAVCKRCSTPLVEGQTCRKSMENVSNGRKPHADLLVLQCLACGAEKRWPVGARRQERKTRRVRGTEKPNDTPTVANAERERN